MEVTARQSDRVASIPFSLHGDGQWERDGNELDIQAGQRVRPDRQQVRSQEHLVDNQIVAATGECCGRGACLVQHAPPDVAVPDDHDRVTVGVVAGAVIPESVSAERSVTSTAPIR